LTIIYEEFCHSCNSVELGGIDLNIRASFRVEIASFDLRDIYTEVLFERLEIILIHILEELAHHVEVCFIISPSVVKEGFVDCEKHELNETIEKVGHDVWLGFYPLVEKEFSRLATLD
jgi:hypothetical protein